MSAASELAVNRRNTVAFIAARPTSVVLTPHLRSRTDEGGRSNAPQSARLPQLIRMVDQSSGGAVSTDVQDNEDGTSNSHREVAVAAWDAVWAKGDTFTRGTDECEIVRLFPDNGYERRAEVIVRGS